MVDEAARHADDPGSLVRALAQIMAGRLEGSGYQSGCAIATLVLELAPATRNSAPTSTACSPGGGPR